MNGEIVIKKIISKKDAGDFLINYQQFHSEKCSKKKIMEFINKVGCIQYDPVDVVGINNDIMLRSRFKNYKKQDLYDLLYEERMLIDGFDKNMSIYPTRDWPYLKRNREKVSDWNKLKNGEIQKIAPKIRETIEEKGPICSLDLNIKKKIDWFWSPANIGKAVLEAMYFNGELIVHRKINKRKYYDFTHRHIDEKILNSENPVDSLEKYHDWYLLRRINSIGFLWNKRSDALLGIDNFKAAERNSSFKRLLKNGLIKEFHIEETKEKFYISTENYNDLQNNSERKKVSFIAPLDNLLWDRTLIKEIFGFEYVWEIYKPKSKRIYGYYVLPVLYGNKLVGRIEPKRDSKKKSLIINNFWWEKNIRKTDRLMRELNEALNNFREFHSLSKIEFSQQFKNTKENILILENMRSI